jgi:hypothetical protein
MLWAEWFEWNPDRNGLEMRSDRRFLEWGGVQSYSAVAVSRGFLYVLEGVCDDMLLLDQGNELGWQVPMYCRFQGTPSTSVGTVIVLFAHDVGGCVWSRLRIVLRHR